MIGNKNKVKKLQASALIYFISLFMVFLAFAAFAVDGAIVLTNRMKLQNITETTALAAASEFNYSSMASSSDIQKQVGNTATNTFSVLKSDGLSNASIDNLNVSTASNKVLIKTSMIAQPYFLAFLGVSGIDLSAQACAVSEQLPVTANYSGVNWITAKAAYYSDIVSKKLNLNDTAILLPLGDFKSASYDFNSGAMYFNLLNSDDSQPLSLGPGGFVTIKLPAPIIDKSGYDLYIKEAGDALEGYMVFAGLDNDPTDPYVNVDKAGSGISWMNISCAGVSSDLGTNAHQQAATKLGTAQQDKFYGSGYFDIGDSCTGGMSMVKYIRIVDDNSESAFVNTNGTYYKTMQYGEASTATSGADIDNVKVLNHVRLIAASSFS